MHGVSRCFCDVLSVFFGSTGVSMCFFCRSWPKPPRRFWTWSTIRFCRCGLLGVPRKHAAQFQLCRTPRGESAYTRSHKGVSNEVPHTTYRLPNRAPLGGSWFNSSLLPQPRPKAPNSSLPPFLACWPIVAPVHKQWGDPILSSDFFRPSHHRGSAGGNGSKWRRSWLQKRFHPSHLSSNWQHM